MSALTPDERPRGQVVDARLHLLDRQVLDPRRKPVATVADLELVPAADGTVVIGSLLFGSAFLARLVGGHPPSSRMHRVPWRDVTSIGQTVRLAVDADSLDVTWTERWLADHVVGRIPGARHDPE